MPRPRKTEDERRDSVVQIRLTAEEREWLKAVAKRERRTLSDWIRTVALQALGLPKELVE